MVDGWSLIEEGHADGEEELGPHPKAQPRPDPARRQDHYHLIGCPPPVLDDPCRWPAPSDDADPAVGGDADPDGRRAAHRTVTGDLPTVPPRASDPAQSVDDTDSAGPGGQV